MPILLFRLFAWIATQLELFLLDVLACGPIPQHVAFVMDGNRRYARGRRMDVKRGHVDGFASLRRMLEVCLHMHIHCVTVYAFSIENFKRPPDEVDALMNLAHDRLLELSEKGDLLEKYNVRVNIIGRRSLLPAFVQEAMQEVENKTRLHKKAILNICMPYTSRDEIAFAVENVVKDALAGKIDINDITEHTIDRALAISKAESPPLDILVRTSGVQRLSDFMLWQCCENTRLQFVNTYWPDFSLRDFLPIIFDYQLSMLRLQSRRRQSSTNMHMKSL